MRKNKMMRIASALLVAVLLTTCAISGTFAKYVTSASGNDKARVAYWGWNQDTEMDLSGLFTDTYLTDVDSGDNADVIAPGTTAKETFKFAYVDYNATVKAPEVDYNFEITVTETCDDLIKNNKNIKWYLDDEAMTGTALTWDQLVDAIVKLSGATTVTETGDKHTATVKYDAGNVPAAFAVDMVHTISWQWVFDGGSNEYAVAGQTGTGTDNKLTQDEYDTYMGNADVLANCSITIEIVITQVDD